MEATINVEKTVNLKTIHVKAEVRYWEDAYVNGVSDDEGDLIPCRDGDFWCPEIDIDSGVILNWEKGKTAKVHYKVCDCCGWDIKDEEGNIVASVDDDYVPNTLSPADSGYGDYIIMNIDENGKIDRWYFEVDDFYDRD